MLADQEADGMGTKAGSGYNLPGHASVTNLHQSGPTTSENSSMCQRLDVQTLKAVEDIKDLSVNLAMNN